MVYSDEILYIAKLAVCDLGSITILIVPIIYFMLSYDVYVYVGRHL